MKKHLFYIACLLIVLLVVSVKSRSQWQTPYQYKNSLLKNQVPDTSKMIKVEGDTILLNELTAFFNDLKPAYRDSAVLTPNQILSEFYRWVLIERTRKKKPK